MCGIAGLVDPTGAPIDAGVLAGMTRTVAPRGPDGEGMWQAPAVVWGLLHDHLSGRRDRRKALWTLFVFERWLATWGRATQ